jgi:hypothetical protein
MSRSKQHIALLLCCLLSACKGPQAAFDASTNINARFFEKIPAVIAQAETRTPPVFTEAIVYKTTFRQAYAEAENVLVEALLHDSSVTKPVRYLKGPEGYRQDLYLVRLKSKSRNDYFVYFSVWYNDANEDPQIGFGPAYLGKKYDTLNSIVSMSELSMKDSGARYYMAPKKKGRQFFFVLDALPENQIGIQRIVVTEKNKIGGNKKMVYVVPGSLLDKLIFTRTAIIPLQ